MLLYKSGLKNNLTISSNCAKCVKLSELTTYGLGGYANCYFPETPYQAKRIYADLIENGEKVTILGNGSNILASDNNYTGYIICLRKMRGIVRLDKDKILCLAGTSIASILKYCNKNNLSGIEYMYGIPASIGGAAYMNAGVGNQTISNNIVFIDYFGDFSGKISSQMCNFGYRHSTMRDINGVILAVVLKLTQSSAQEIDEKINFYKLKRAHLPKGKSCGCIFKNGADYSSGELIDKAGLKGLRCGGAYISEYHANFIINDGGSADDVKRLINTAKSRVLDKFGIELQEEVVYIGDF